MGNEYGVELGDFLRSRRARVTPDQIGVPTEGTTRRVPGLRREEIAQLAGVSTEYYTRLEQGRRHRNASVSVLDAIARALRLDEVEHAYLIELARGGSHGGERHTLPPRPQRVRPELHRILETLDAATPAFISGRGMQVLAGNRMAGALIADFDALPYRERNFARFVFLDEGARDLFPDWYRVAEDVAAGLRLEAGRRHDDRVFSELIGELAVKRAEFRSLWARHDIRQRTHGTKLLRHPLVGELTISYATFSPCSDTDQVLYIYSTEPGSASETALQLLANLTAGPRRPQLNSMENLLS
ncbi:MULTISPECIES: helix-turn-helix domain-containing protein [Streptomyces]|uniref:helix-turn-helix domain-containing protein n=1 Tax=Streptomyces lycopersici TaxID=2974589 RepID=UPI0021D16A39|nr:helix-turn-helix transcriptional regulator [Streptomyces sp. NEAU-383]